MPTAVDPSHRLGSLDIYRAHHLVVLDIPGFPQTAVRVACKQWLYLLVLRSLLTM